MSIHIQIGECYKKDQYTHTLTYLHEINMQHHDEMGMIQKANKKGIGRLSIVIILVSVVPTRPYTVMT